MMNIVHNMVPIMARRNDHTREELIALTLDEVKNFLHQNSHHELSLRKIANMIGYAPSTLVNVFGNYNLLLLHAVAETVDELKEHAAKAVKPAAGPKEALYQLAFCYHDFAKANPYRWQLIFQHTMSGETLPKWQVDRIDQLTGMLEELIMIIFPGRSKAEVEQASRVLWAGVHGITLLSVDDKFFTQSPVDGKQLITNLLDNYLSGWQA
jgi:AcrR family transcriptional regulator